MKRLLRSKLVLSLTAFIMIVTAVAIPLASSLGHSHAAGASGTGEQHHSLAVHPQVSGTPIPITVDCSAPMSSQVIADFNPADQVSVTAVLTSTDTNEATENEMLVLHETNGSFNPTPITIPSNLLVTAI